MIIGVYKELSKQFLLFPSLHVFMTLVVYYQHVTYLLESRLSVLFPFYYDNYGFFCITLLLYNGTHVMTNPNQFHIKIGRSINRYELRNIDWIFLQALCYICTLTIPNARTCYD